MYCWLRSTTGTDQQSKTWIQMYVPEAQLAQKGSCLPHMQPSCTLPYWVTFHPSVCALHQRTSKGWSACIKNYNENNRSETGDTVGCWSDPGAESWYIRHGLTAMKPRCWLGGAAACVLSSHLVCSQVCDSSTFHHSWVQPSLLSRQRKDKMNCLDF